MLNRPNILVCTDFSSYSDLAVGAASSIQKKAGGGRVHMLHLSEFPVGLSWNKDESVARYKEMKFQSEIRKDVEEKFKKQARIHQVDCTTQLVTGVPFTYIHEVIKNEHFDLVILGHKGRLSTPLALGSLAEKMVASAEIPVLVTKKKMDLQKVTGLIDTHFPITKIVNATEEMASLFSCQMELISLLKDASISSEELQKAGIHPLLKDAGEVQRLEYLEKLKLYIKSQVTRYFPCEIKVDFATDNKIAYQLLGLLEEDVSDMIVMQRQQKTAFEKYFIGSETKRMLDLFEGNLLILPT